MGTPCSPRKTLASAGAHFTGVSRNMGSIWPDGRKGVRSQESGVRSQESGVRSQESGVRSQESGVRSQESGVRSQEPGVRSQEPGVRSQEPGARSQEPGARSQEPGARSQEPEARSQEPGIGGRLIAIHGPEGRRLTLQLLTPELIQTRPNTSGANPESVRGLAPARILHEKSGSASVDILQNEVLES